MELMGYAHGWEDAMSQEQQERLKKYSEILGEQTDAPNREQREQRTED